MNNYFSHDSNARNSDKIILLRAQMGAEGYGIYFMILERLREEPTYMSVKDYNMLAFDLRVDSAKIKAVVENFGLFVFTDDDKYFYSESFLRRMQTKDDKSEKARKSALSRWNKCERNANAMRTHENSDANKEKKSKEKDIIPLSTDVDIPPFKNPESDSVISKAEEKEKSCDKREKDFYDSLIPYVAIYGSTMIRSFFDYWTERNKSRSKMRYELQQTWDLSKRLKTWENKQKEYEKRNSKGGCDSEKSDESLMRHIAAGYARGMEELRRREH